MKNLSRIVPCCGTWLIVFFLFIIVNSSYAQLATKGASVNNQNALQRKNEIGQNLLAHPTQVQSSKTDQSNGWVVQSYLDHIWNKKAWLDYERLSNTYDENGNHIGSMAERYDTITSKWQPVIKEAWTYDSLGVETLYSETTWNGSTPWLSQTILSYNEKGYDTIDLQQNWINSAWVDNSRNVFTYDDEGNAITALSQNWRNNQWVNSGFYTATYDVDGNRMSLTKQDWNNNAWTNYGRETYSYYSNGNPSTTLQEAWISNGWVNNLRDSYTFDAQGYPKTMLEQSWKGGVWVNSVQDSYTCDSYGNTLSSYESIWKSNAWQNSFWIQYTWMKLSGNIEILKPLKGETLLADTSYSIKWHSSNIDSIKIEYSTDNGTTFHKITSGVAANKSGYLWHVPDVLSSKCMIRITDLNDPTETAKSPVFRIKGYVLTRLNAKGDFELFDPALHAWQFKNDGNMWPVSWLSLFDYMKGDPYTNLIYPLDFILPPIRARSTNFVDWPLFAKTFGPGNCYVNLTQGAYSPTAVNLWAKFKDPKWNGSCFGFSQSCLLAFDRPDEFRLVYPEVGNIQNIHDLQLTVDLRQLINQLYENQFGRQHIVARDAQFHSKNVRGTLEELKSDFLSNDNDHRSINIQDSSGGAHNVVPYQLRKDPIEKGRYLLDVYDNNYPDGRLPDGYSTTIVIDSVNNHWGYHGLIWHGRDWKDFNCAGIYLVDAASQYLTPPLLWDPTPAQNSTKAASTEKSEGTTTYLNIYNSISSNIQITNSTGQHIGFHDDVAFSTFGDGIPIFPANGVHQAAIGYFVPDDQYAIRMSAYTDSLAACSVLNQTGMFNYWRSDAVNNESDRLTYDGGMEFSNSDTKTKTVNLQAINRSTEGENGFKILNFTVVKNDSVRIESPDFNRVAFVNQGPAKTYDLKIVQARESLSGQFEHDRIAIPAHSTQIIVADSLSITNKKVKIYEDKGNTGIISDSIFVAVQVTGIQNQFNTEIDSQSSLLQNYPNPFSTLTTIKYKVTQSGFVSLKIVDAMGTEVASLVNEQRVAGEYTVDWNAAGFENGLYLCNLQNGKSSESLKMLKTH